MSDPDNSGGALNPTIDSLIINSKPVKEIVELEREKFRLVILKLLGKK